MEMLGLITGVVLALAGVTTSVLCLFAIGDGEVRRGLAGVLAGACLLAVGAWLSGALSGFLG